MSLLDPRLEAFMNVVKYKTVHAAADALFMTQTAITQRIKLLEEKLSVSLFVRSRRGMALTAEGESLLHYCQSVRMLEGEFFSKILGHDEDAIVSVTIQAPTSLMRTRIIPNSVRVLSAYKNIRANFQVNDIENRHLALKSGECDLAILLPEHITPEMNYKKINPDEYIIVGHKKWKNRSIEEVVKSERIIDYDPTDNMTFNYLKAFNLFEHSHKDRHFVNNPEALVALIANEVGYSVVTREFYNLCKKDYEISVLNDEKEIIHPIYLCWYQRNQMPNYFSSIIQAIS